VNGLSTDVAGLLDHQGAQLGHTAWRPVEQLAVNRFADVTNDHNPIHVDPVYAARTPFGGTIAHGLLTLSLLAPMINELLQVRGASVSVNYGLDRVRFPAPVPAGARIRAGAELLEATEIDGGVQVKVGASVQVQGTEKPAVVAECLFRFYA
jgi:acyl dehydratase